MKDDSCQALGTGGQVDHRPRSNTLAVPVTAASCLRQVGMLALSSWQI